MRRLERREEQAVNRVEEFEKAAFALKWFGAMDAYYDEVQASLNEKVRRTGELLSEVVAMAEGLAKDIAGSPSR